MVVVVYASMPGEFVRTGETFLTPRMGAEEWLFACMGSDVACLSRQY